ncbi:MAG: DNRLRE domain-containing protein [Deltaproteobacteria bacterium]|nr:DNRLRE domain-containing protein [Deltaproteobacteria bacterium]
MIEAKHTQRKKSIFFSIALIFLFGFLFISCNGGDGTGNDPNANNSNNNNDNNNNNNGNQDSAFILYPQKDNTLYENATGSVSNGEGSVLIVGRTNEGSTYLRRAVLMFDIASDVPAGATITNAILRLSTKRVASNTARTIDLYRIESNWDQGTSSINNNAGQGDASTTGDATWIHGLYNTVMWTTAGGDYNATSLASVDVTSANNSYEWTSNDLIADVQDMLDNPSTNYGWILIGDESTSKSAKIFSSLEGTSAPELELEFDEP